MQGTNEIQRTYSVNRKRNEDTIEKSEKKPIVLPNSESYDDKELEKLLLDWKVPSSSDGANSFLAVMLFNILKKKNE